MLPDKFKWIDEIGPLPKVIENAIQYLGVREVKGQANNPVIMQMAKELGLEKIFVSDDTQAWCALFVNYILKISEKPMVDIKGDKYNLLRAKYLLNYGEPVKYEDAMLGDVVVIHRPGGWHTFFVIAKTPAGNPIGIGGNQGNQVSIDEFDKDRVDGIRRFYSTAPPESVKAYVVDSTGKLSTNET